MNELLIDVKNVDPRLLDAGLLGQVKEKKRLRDWNESAVIMIIKLHREQIDPLKALINTNFPNAFICYDRREYAGVKFLILSENDLMLAKEILLEENRKAVEERK